MKKIIFTALITASIFSSHAFALGQGAIAGSASMFLARSGEVGHVSSSIAIGKANAYSTGDILLGATAATSASNTSSTGTGAAIAITNTGILTTGEEVVGTGLDVAQVNVMNSGTISLDVTKAADGDATTPTFTGTAAE